jgi:hypothetical protein
VTRAQRDARTTAERDAEIQLDVRAHRVAVRDHPSTGLADRDEGREGVRLGRFAVTRRSAFGVRFDPPALTVWWRDGDVWRGYLLGRRHKVRGS